MDEKLKCVCGKIMKRIERNNKTETKVQIKYKCTCNNTGLVLLNGKNKNIFIKGPNGEMLKFDTE